MMPPLHTLDLGRHEGHKEWEELGGWGSGETPANAAP